MHSLTDSDYQNHSSLLHLIKLKKRNLSNEKDNKYTLLIFMFYCVNQAKVITEFIDN